MLKLLIVEDERWEREGLIDLFDWNRLGIEIAGTAVDGIDGLVKADALVPDILISDIKMPGMDGIEMSKRLKEKYPNLKIILLTGFDDFAYAREAIQFRANDYVLKPIEEEELMKVVVKVAEECRQDRIRLNETAQLREQVRKNKWLDMLEGRVSEEMIMDPCNLAETDTMKDRFAVWSVSKPAWPGKWETPEQLQSAIQEPIRVLFGEGAEGDWIGLLATTAEGAHLLEQTTAVLMANEGRLPGNLSTIGISQTVEGPSALRECCRQARTARQYGEFWGVSGAIPYSEVASLQEDFSRSAHDILKRAGGLTRQIVQGIGGLDEEKTIRIIHELLDLLASHRGAGKDFIGSYLNGVVLEISLLVNDRTLYGHIPEQTDMEGVRSYMNGFVKQALSILGEKRNDTEEYVVKKIVALIEQPSHSADINLKTTAAELFLSPNYVGSLFKKTTGKSFHDYLTEWRMEKAKELLRFPNKKVSKVAEEVGMPNASYFIAVFKNVVGMSPGEYQGIHSLK